jgi:hypothetical protein
MQSIIAAVLDPVSEMRKWPDLFTTEHVSLSLLNVTEDHCQVIATVPSNVLRYSLLWRLDLLYPYCNEYNSNNPPDSKGQLRLQFNDK